MMREPIHTDPRAHDYRTQVEAPNAMAANETVVRMDKTLRPLVPRMMRLVDSYADFLHWQLRDRSFEAQRHRASGLNLVVAAIILWNTVYLERAIGALRQQGRQIGRLTQTYGAVPLEPP